jgi:hypothetical protein
MKSPMLDKYKAIIKSPEMKTRRFIARRRGLILGVLYLLYGFGGLAAGVVPHQVIWAALLSYPLLYWSSNYILRKLYPGEMNETPPPPNQKK